MAYLVALLSKQYEYVESTDASAYEVFQGIAI